MAEKKTEKKDKFAGEEKLSEAVGKIDAELRKELGTRPYLLVVATGYELGREGHDVTLAAQWSWRSNVIIGGTDSEKMAEFLSNQLKEAVEHPEHGVKKTYSKKK